MLPKPKTLIESGLGDLVVAMANTPEHWPLRAEACGLFAQACEIAARINAYDDMLRGCAKLCTLAAELQSPVLLNQAKEIYERFEVETQARPLFQSIDSKEVN